MFTSLFFILRRHIYCSVTVISVDDELASIFSARICSAKVSEIRFFRKKGYFFRCEIVVDFFEINNDFDISIIFINF